MCAPVFPGVEALSGYIQRERDARPAIVHDAVLTHCLQHRFSCTGIACQVTRQNTTNKHYIALESSTGPAGLLMQPFGASHQRGVFTLTVHP